MMEIVPYQPGEGRALFGYWHGVGKSIPYFYPVTFEAWQRCLLADRLAGEPLFQHVDTGYALAGGRIVGMVQYGQPYFTWDADGGSQGRYPGYHVYWWCLVSWIFSF